PCCYTVISGCACAYACKTRCRPLPWRWFTARSRAVELRRTSEDRVLAVAATRRLSAERVAGDVQEHAIGDREPHSASSGASWKSLRSTVIDDPSRSGAGDGTGDRSIPGRSAAFH